MTVRKLLEKLKGNKTIEIKEDEYTTIIFESNKFVAVPDWLLNREISDFRINGNKILINYGNEV